VTATRSSRLWAETQVGKIQPALYTVPDGLTVILKTIYVSTAGTGPSSVSFFIYRPSPTAQVFIFSADLQPYAPASWSGWVVLEPADQVYLLLDTGTVNSWGSGASLPA